MDTGIDAPGSSPDGGAVTATTEPATRVLASDSDGLDGSRWGSRHAVAVSPPLVRTCLSDGRSCLRSVYVASSDGTLSTANHCYNTLPITPSVCTFGLRKGTTGG